MDSVSSRPPLAQAPSAPGARIRRYSASVDLSHSPEELWPYISNMDESNRRLGLPKVDYAFEPLETGGAVMRGRFKMAGFRFEYTESPFEWVAPNYLQVERFYTRGLFKYFKFRAVLKSHEGGTRITVTMDIVPWLPIMPLGPVMRKQVSEFIKLYRGIDARITPESVSGRPGFEAGGPDTNKKETQALKVRIQQLRESWAHLCSDKDLPGRLARYVLLAPELDVKRMRPRTLARLIHRPTDDVLRFCLKATREGFLSMSWSVLCPSCKGPKLQASSLGGLQAEAHCESCNIQYDASFDKNVEVTFSPAEKVRAVTIGDFCFGSPANTSHVFAQFPIGAEASRSADLWLPNGSYRLKCTGSGAERIFKVESGAKCIRLELRLGDSISGDVPGSIGHELGLDLLNSRPGPALFCIERLSERDEALTAHELTTLQDFRDLFGSEVLRPGAELKVSSAVLLFTDLKDSTAMYERRGDAPAFALVQDHFDVMFEVIRKHRGSVVKTIGDAVMAVFTTVEGGVGASIEILRRFEEWNDTHPDDRQVLVKIGLHQGPCIIITQNDKLDYFGSSVNRAARVQGAAGASEVVLSEEIFLDLGAQRVLEAIEGGPKVEKFRAELKGIEARMQLFRVTLPRPAASAKRVA